MSELADKLAQYFKPDGVVVWTADGREANERRAANGSDSAMIVLTDTDGGRYIRALTFDEIAEAVERVSHE